MDTAVVPLIWWAVDAAEIGLESIAWRCRRGDSGEVQLGCWGYRRFPLSHPEMDRLQVRRFPDHAQRTIANC